jgi:hypothetical protein
MSVEYAMLGIPWSAGSDDSSDRVLWLAKRMYGRAIRPDAEQDVFDAMWLNGMGKDSTMQSLMMDVARVAVRDMGPGLLFGPTGQSAIDDLRMLRNVYKEFVITREQADAILKVFERPTVWIESKQDATVEPERALPIPDEDV